MPSSSSTPAFKVLPACSPQSYCYRWPGCVQSQIFHCYFPRYLHPHPPLLDFSLLFPCLSGPGNRILSLGEVPKDQLYPLKLKGISICFSILKAALCGNYVNFGVFRLYGDDALDNALQTAVKLLLTIPHTDLLVCLSLSDTLPSLIPYRPALASRWEV